MLGAFIEQVIEDGAGFGPKPFKEIVAFAAAAERRVQSQMAEQIEWVGSLSLILLAPPRLTLTA